MQFHKKKLPYGSLSLVSGLGFQQGWVLIKPSLMSGAWKAFPVYSWLLLEGSNPCNSTKKKQPCPRGTSPPSTERPVTCNDLCSECLQVMHGICKDCLSIFCQHCFRSPRCLSCTLDPRDDDSAPTMPEPLITSAAPVEGTKAHHPPL